MFYMWMSTQYTLKASFIRHSVLWKPPSLFYYLYIKKVSTIFEQPIKLILRSSCELEPQLKKKKRWLIQVQCGYGPTHHCHLPKDLNANYWDPFQTYWVRNYKRNSTQKPSVLMRITNSGPQALAEQPTSEHLYCSPVPWASDLPFSLVSFLLSKWTQEVLSSFRQQQNRVKHFAHLTCIFYVECLLNIS